MGIGRVSRESPHTGDFFLFFSREKLFFPRQVIVRLFSPPLFLTPGYLFTPHLVFLKNISNLTLSPLPTLPLSLVHPAAKWGGEKVTKVLLEAGAMVAQATTLGVQPLHMAAQEGQVRARSANAP